MRLENEAIMQQAWKDLAFDTQTLKTTDGLDVQLINPGILNLDQGPDFLNGRVMIDGVEWNGDVELHLESKDWNAHGHDRDPNYRSVVLHVVMDTNPRAVARSDGTVVPCISLAGRISQGHVADTRKRLERRGELPCGELAARFSKQAALLADHAGHRARERIVAVNGKLEESRFDWEQVIWEGVMGVMGGPVNADAFKQLARALPYKVVRRYHGNPKALQALLFGTAGFLKGDKAAAKHPELAAEWKYLGGKHTLDISWASLQKHRMRPASHPEKRLIQVLSLVGNMPDLVSWLGKDGLKRLHTFIKQANHGESPLPGTDVLQRMAINVLIPMGAAFLAQHGLADPVQHCVAWWNELEPEDNKITRRYARYGWQAHSAAESQGMLHLSRNLCDQLGCTACPVWRVRDGPFNAKQPSA